MMPPKIGSQRVRRETGRSRHHAIVFSITAPYCSSFPSPFVSVRFGANPLHVASWHCHAIAIPPSSCPFLSVASRSVSFPSHFASFRGVSISLLFSSLSIRNGSHRRGSFLLLLTAGPRTSPLSLSISLRIATSLFRSFAGLTRGAVSAYVGHAASLGRPPPTRSGPCRCCATGTSLAVRRSQAIRARSPRPWGSSRGC